MSKTPDPAEVLRDKVAPTAEELVSSVAERVAPLAREAVEQVSPVAQAAAEKTVALVHAAADKVAPLTHQAVEAVTPLAQQTRDAVAPYAHAAADAVAPYAHSAADAVAPYAHSAAEAVAPYASLAREQGLKAGHDLADRLEPAYEAARDALSGARDKVTGDVLPAVGAAASGAAASAAPLVGAASERGKAVVRAARGETVVVPPKKKRGWLTTLAIVGAAAAATYVLVRKLVGDKGSQWQTARPTTPYVPPTSAAAAAGASTASDARTDQQTGPSAHDTYRAADGAAEPDQPAEGGDAEVEDELAARSGGSDPVAEPSTTSLYGGGQPAGDEDLVQGTDDDSSAIAADVERTDAVADADEGTGPVPRRAAEPSEDAGGTGATDDGSGDEASSPYADEKLETELGTVEERAYEEPEDAVTIEQDTATGIGPDAHPERYAGIAGVYLGVEPPEGYTIKGNERSMKYHLPDSNSYGRTIAEIWFDSEDAARQAGFERAQH